MVVYVESRDLVDVLNISTIKQGSTYIEATITEPTIDISKLEGYKLSNTETGGYSLSFDSAKYSAFIKGKQKEEAIKNGEAIKAQLQDEYIMSLATDGEAFSMRYLYPEYAVGVKYRKGDRFMYQDKFYKVVSGNEFTSTLEWKPDSTPSLYVEIPDPNVEYPEFKQPINAETAYAKGAKVTYKNEKYVSLIANNAYSPEAYPAGWKKVV